MTATTPPTYRAQTDPGTKNWHLGALHLDAKCYCGTVLMTPGDRRKFALKVAEADRNYTTDLDLTKVSCGACKRNREYTYAVGTATRPEPTTGTTTRRRRSTAPRTTAPSATPSAPAPVVGEAETVVSTRRRKGGAHARTVDPAEAANLAANAAAATPQGPKPRRRSSKADKSHAAAERDRARRESAARAETALAAIDEALSGNIADNPEAPANAALAATRSAEYRAEAAANAE